MEKTFLIPDTEKSSEDESLPLSASRLSRSALDAEKRVRKVRGERV